MRTYWLWYVLTAFTLFAIPETTALATGHPERTLSEFVWRTFDVIRSQPMAQWSFQHFAFAGVFSLTAVWLIGHFGWGLWR